MKFKKIAKVLMCQPSFFDTLDYVINPWMKPGKINEERALREWNSLVELYKKLNISVEVIEQKKEVLIWYLQQIKESYLKKQSF